MALTFKLSVDVQLSAIELVTPVLAKTHILKFISATWGNKSWKHLALHAQTSAKAVDRLYAQICVRTSNLLDSYYLKIIFSERSLDIRTSSFVYNYYVPEDKLKRNIPCNDAHSCGLAAILCEIISCHSKIVKQVKRHRNRESSRLPIKIKISQYRLQTADRDKMQTRYRLQTANSVQNADWV